MDISSIKTNERVIEILHPATEKELGCRMTIISLIDPKLKSLKRKIKDARLKLEQKGKNFTAEELDNIDIDVLVECITSWDWYGDKVTFHGQKPEFTKENVKAVLTELPWLKSQIEIEVGSEQDFF